MEASRRSILKMFGMTAAVATAGVAVAEIEAVPAAAKFDYTPPPAPEGMTYQWKRVFITQDEPDLENILLMVKNGWKPVPATRHPEVYPPNGSYWVEIGGMVLMEKPSVDIPAPVAYPTPWLERVSFR